jgi:hypothetical protein
MTYKAKITVCSEIHMKTFCVITMQNFVMLNLVVRKVTGRLFRLNSIVSFTADAYFMQPIYYAHFSNKLPNSRLIFQHTSLYKASRPHIQSCWWFPYSQISMSVMSVTKAHLSQSTIYIKPDKHHLSLLQRQKTILVTPQHQKTMSNTQHI